MISQIFKYIEENQDHYVKRLSEAIAIPSVSVSYEHRSDVIRMGKWIENELNRLGAKYYPADKG